MRPKHGCMARGGHEPSKVLPGLAMLYPYTPCGRANPETALRPCQEWPTCRASDLWLASTPSDTPRRTPLDLDGHQIKETTTFSFS
jgi:hypothetical protein